MRPPASRPTPTPDRTCAASHPPQARAARGSAPTTAAPTGASYGWSSGSGSGTRRAPGHYPTPGVPAALPQMPTSEPAMAPGMRHCWISSERATPGGGSPPREGGGGGNAGGNAGGHAPWRHRQVARAAGSVVRRDRHHISARAGLVRVDRWRRRRTRVAWLLPPHRSRRSRLQWGHARSPIFLLS